MVWEPCGHYKNEDIYQNEKTFYLVGGKDAIIEKTILNLKTDFPNISILGHRNGYLNNDDERQALIEEITKKKPDVVFVAMGSPAPKWWIDHKLEGIYRTMMEPRKRIMRDIRLIPYFIKLILNKL